MTSSRTKFAFVNERPWSPEQAETCYHMRSWGGSYFFVNDKGHVEVRPSAGSKIDLADIATELGERGIPMPALIRFQDVLRSRVTELNNAFARARREYAYGADYVGVYPIKVNQLHEVVEEVLEAGKPYNLGLECGSKTELVATLALLENDETLLICNGYKDAATVRLILDAQILGKNVIPVVEKLDEFERIWAQATELGITPRFGVRARLSSNGSGHWAESSGGRSKFGITFTHLLAIVKVLEEHDCTDALALLHFHLGSQISNIMSLNMAVKELSQVYVHLVQRGVPVRYLDVGGGLGVNYTAGFAREDDDGINYTLQEYANGVVSAVKETCAAASVVEPIIVSESGRALTAHHSVLLVQALSAYGQEGVEPDFEPDVNDHALVQQLFSSLCWVRKEPPISLRELLEAYHEASAARTEAASTFRLGYLSLEQSALIDRLFWQICWGISERVQGVDAGRMPLELLALDDRLVDQYLCDFSVFQSMLDHWAIGQRFPIVPIQRLNQEPTRRGVLVDLTCDSDGKVSRYVSTDPERNYLELHALQPGEPYYLGFFLMGAYQDIMGDSHNLFGRVPEVHVYADEEEANGYYIEKIIPGTQVESMLAQVQYFPNDLKRRMADIVRKKIDSKLIRAKQGIALLERYAASFADTTYYRASESDTVARKDIVVDDIDKVRADAVAEG